MHSSKIIISISLIWLGLLVLYIVHSLFGDLFVTYIYHEDSYSLLNHVLEGRDDNSLEFYINKTNLLVNKIIIWILIPSFCYFIYTLSKSSPKLLNALSPWLNRHINFVCVTSLILFSILLRLPYFFTSVIGLDEGTYLLMGQSIVDGNLPYIELWDLKPPLAYAPYAITIWLFDNNIIAIRLLGAICLGIGAYFIYLSCKYIWGYQVGLIAALVSILFMSTMALGQATSLEIIITVPLMGALAILVIRGINSQTSFQIGFILSVAVLMRLNLAYLVVIIGLVLCIYPLLAKNSGTLTKNFMMYSIGGFIPLAIIVLPYAITDNLNELFKSLVELPLIYSSSQNSALQSLRSIFTETRFFGINNAILWIGFLAGIILIIKAWTNYTSERKFISKS